MTEYAGTINERLMLDRIAELDRQIAEACKAAAWARIDEEHLPKVEDGDEVGVWHGGKWHRFTSMVNRTAEEWINLGWTHYRPINAPRKEQAMKPRKAIPRVSKARRARSGVPGRLGIVRLWGADIEPLRDACFERDMGICLWCGKRLYKQARFAGDPDAYDMAHCGSRRLYGDVITNVRSLCHSCHMKEHAGLIPVVPERN